MEVSNQYYSISFNIDSNDEVLIPAPYWTTYPEEIAGGSPVFIKTQMIMILKLLLMFGKS